MADGATWTFLSNHAHVVILLGNDPALRMRDLAERIGVTERAIQRIVHELAEAGYLEVHKEGRRNRYEVRRDRTLRHPIEAGVRVGALIDLVDRPGR
ncbi:MAG: winged helix-turn-helix domain-containing protein [Myxococcota bacterium]